MTYADFHHVREEARRQTFSHKNAKKKKQEQADATIQVGVISGDDLKVKKGSNLPIKVSSDITADALLSVAVQKHSRFNKDLINCNNAYKLLYPDKSVVETLPGVEETFTLSRYKDELGKPYSRIIFYICDLKDYAAEKIRMLEATIEDDDDEEDCSGASFANKGMIQTILIKEEDSQSTSCDTARGPATPSRLGLQPKPATTAATCREEKVQCPTCNLIFRSREIEVHADSCAQQHSNEVIEQFYDDCEFQTILHANNRNVKKSEPSETLSAPSIQDIVREISNKITTNTSRVNVRRDRLFDDYVETRTKFPWFKTDAQLIVTFMGEPAIDTGGPKREFLSDVLEEIKRILFVDGEPVYNTEALNSMMFKFAGELMAMSIAHGGPSPSLLKEWVFEYFITGISGIKLSPGDLKSPELKSFVTQLMNCKDPKEVQGMLTNEYGLDLLEQIGFRGVPNRVDLNSRDQVVRSILLKNVVLDKVPMIVQLADGLQLFGVIDAITCHPQLMKPLFCVSDENSEINENSFMNNVQVQFSDSQQKKQLEENTYKHFADFASYLYHQGIDRFNLGSLLKFTTGTSRIPILGFPSPIKVNFVHGCQPECRCRPTASTCDLLLRIPVHHNTLELMKETFTSAFIEGNAYGVI